jgi:hypothetical protein
MPVRMPDNIMLDYRTTAGVAARSKNPYRANLSVALGLFANFL